MTTPEKFSDRVRRDLDRGEILDGDTRYLMIRADVLMGMFHLLEPDIRQRAMAALRESVSTHGGRSARRYQTLGIGQGSDAARKLVSTIESTAPELGWGVWTFSAIGETEFTVTVNNSPFVAGYGESEEPVCAPICGMLSAVGELILGQAVLVSEQHCGAHSDYANCCFDVRLGDVNQTFGVSENTS